MDTDGEHGRRAAVHCMADDATGEQARAHRDDGWNVERIA